MDSNRLKNSSIKDLPRKDRLAYLNDELVPRTLGLIEWEEEFDGVRIILPKKLFNPLLLDEWHFSRFLNGDFQ